MRKSLDYFVDLKNDNHKIAVFVATEPFKFIGRIKEVLYDGIVLEKSERFDELFINSERIISVRKWTEKD